MSNVSLPLGGGQGRGRVSRAWFPVWRRNYLVWRKLAVVAQRPNMEGVKLWI